MSRPTEHPAPTEALAEKESAAAAGLGAVTDGPAVDADLALAVRCANSGQYLAGLIATAMLDHVGQPARLPELLWPAADPALVRQVWEAGLATGYRAGQRAARPEWTADGLDRARGALREAGYQRMARHVARTLSVHQPSPHPADRDTHAGAARHGGERP
ncbi:hypothetical protein [Streptomyces hebeiensis]